MNGAELFVQCLENEGVTTIFGVPGEENEDFLFALKASPIRFIPTRHEQGAAFMANVWGRLTGEAGVCLSTLGPGATNLMTGVADAFLDKSPLIAITGQGGRERMHHESHQMINITSLFQVVNKYTSGVIEAQVIPEIVRKAFKESLAEKPGPSLIELPEDIAGQELTEEKPPIPIHEIRRPSPDAEAMNQAVTLIQQASRPLFFVGNGAIRTRASDALRAICASTQIPCVNTFMGKGAISAQDPLYIGTAGLGFKDYIAEAFEQADLIIAVGYDIAEYDPKKWNIGIPKKIIHIDFEPSEVFREYTPEVEVVADVANTLIELSRRLDKTFDVQWFSPIQERIKQSINSYSIEPDSSAFTTPAIINAVREIIHEDGLVLSDVGSHKMWIARNYNTYCPNGCIISNGMASMGIALPGAIAAKILDPKRQVVAMMGDGGALMNFQEIETATRIGTGMVCIILNDNEYGLIRWKQEMSRDEHYGTGLTNPDYVQLAESFGANGHRPQHMEDFKDIFRKALDSKAVHIIEVPIHNEVNNALITELNQYFESK